MKLQKLYPVLGVEAALAAWLAVSVSGGAAATAVFASPWRQLGAGLRALSLWGAGGNIAAWVLYGVVCLAPVGGALALRRRGRGQKADGLLVLLGAVLVPVLYGMVNPALLAGWFSAGVTADIAMAAAGWAVWCVLLGWLVLRLVASAGRLRAGGLYRVLGGMLAAMDLVLVAGVCGTGLAGLLARVAALRAGNTALSAAALQPTVVMLAVGWLVESLPALLGLGVVHRAAALLEAAHADPYSEQTVTAARALSGFCGRAVAAAVLGQMGYGLVQLALAGRLQQVNTDFTVDLAAIGLTLAAMLAAEWLAGGKALKEENEGFI